MPPALFQTAAKSLFSKLKMYTSDTGSGSTVPIQGKNRRSSGRHLASMSAGSSKIRELEGSLFDDQNKDEDNRAQHREVPASQLSWHMQKKILSKKLFSGVDASSILANSHFDDSTVLYNKASSLGGRLLYLMAACRKPLESVGVDDIYQIFEADAENVSPVYFDILEFIGLCLDSRRLRSRSVTFDEPIFSSDMPLLYITRKFEQVILRYVSVDSPLFEKIDDMLDQCEGRVRYDRHYWDAYPAISYVSQLVMYTLLDTAIRERDLEEINSTTLYGSGVMTDNSEPLYPMVYILFRMGHYESLTFLLERYSIGVPDVVGSVCSTFWKLYQGSQRGDAAVIVHEMAALKTLLNSGGYASLVSSSTATETDLFLLDFLHFFKPYSTQALLDSLQHVSVEAGKGFDCIFEFSNLFHLSLTMFLYPETPVENLCITIDDVNFQITQHNISPIRSLISFHNILTYNFYNAIYVLAAEVDLLPEAIGLYFLLAIVCRSYYLNGDNLDIIPASAVTEMNKRYVVSDTSLKTFAGVKDVYDMPLCEFDEASMAYFVNPECLDTTTAMGIGSVLFAFLLCHCIHSNHMELIWISRILPINAQLMLLATLLPFLPLNENIMSQVYFSQEIYPVFRSSLNLDTLKDTVLVSSFIGYPNRLHRLLIFLLGGAYKLKGEAAIAFEYYKTSLTHGNGLELAFECSATILEAGSISSHQRLLPMLASASKLRILYQSNENMRSVSLESMFGDTLISNANIDVHTHGKTTSEVALHTLSSSLYYGYRHVWVMLVLVEAKALLEDTGNMEEVVRLCNRESGLQNMVMSSASINPRLAEKGTVIANFLLNTYSHCQLGGYTGLTTELEVVRELCRKVHTDQYTMDLAVQMCNNAGV
ncbi:Hypothetical protein GLP15_4052 [Giardia lamblia P15]|uniref:Uncharacterized protein n=1 Tax=Giardia intestinalis (strain P15) TaxID=658858 RepID=E1F5G7_GIAIA|nr:Hypothetical protein GLP15_4052 [Giardia lamblia P15]